MHTHDFYIVLAYGVSAVLLVAEVVWLVVRWRKARQGLNSIAGESS